MSNALLKIKHIEAFSQSKHIKANLGTIGKIYERTESVADMSKRVYNSADELRVIADKFVKNIEYFKIQCMDYPSNLP